MMTLETFGKKRSTKTMITKCLTVVNRNQFGNTENHLSFRSVFKFTFSIHAGSTYIIEIFHPGMTNYVTKYCATYPSSNW
jgi:hypothetical protein